MTEPSVSFAGNLTDQPELRHNEGGIAPGDVPGGGVGPAGAGGVVVHRDRLADQAEHAAESLAKGSRVVVVGRLQQRVWTAEDGDAEFWAALGGLGICGRPLME
jgi:single-stranded DNA-binding protein